MIKSMTGFGRGEFSDGSRTALAEMKSVNHRYCEISVKIPRKYAFAEERLKAVARETVHRGKVEINIIVDNVAGDDSRIKLNLSAAKQYYANLKELQESLELQGDIDLALLAGMPDVMRQLPDVEEEESLLKTLETALRAAAGQFDEMRRTEGGKLAEDILHRAGLLAGYTEEIETFAPDIIRGYAEKLRERIKDLLGGTAEIPEERIAVEAALFADKANITEEIVRLRSHLSQLESILSEKEKANGKKLDFLVQELNREANTIGSKANDIRVTGFVLEMKSEVEKIREQIQNIE
ncbi:MAG: YicC family protein [Clostridiales Family XIII bacterium]|jgi:uncharacterized protein (TIGR00255 family)|nr:YicC family protein [Clostridiales Family XIII bacterium]